MAPEPTSLARRLELLLCALAIAFGLGWRAQLAAGPFDREFDGFQGSFFAVCAINYERLGFDALGGYPVANQTARAGEPGTWYAYANHPPLVPWLAYASANLLGPQGWSEAWKENAAPEGLELPLRLPFLLNHAALLAGLVVLLRACGAPRAGWIAGALFAVAPLGVLYGGLVNYENPSLAALVWALVAFASWLRRPRTEALMLACLAFALATSVTFAPAFFLPGLWLWAMLREGRRGLGAALAVSLAAAVPVLAHGIASARVHAGLGLESAGLSERALHLLAPLLDGSQPLGAWLGVQCAALLSHMGLPLSLAFGAAALWLVLPLRSVTGAGATRVLLAGGLLVQFGFYRHTGDPQPNFLVNLLPGACAAIAVAIASLADRLATRTRAPLVPLFVFTPLALAALIDARALVDRQRAPGPLDDPPGTRGPSHPLPRSAAVQLAEILPPDAIGWYPDALAFNNAVFYYAWRTMLPVRPETYAAATVQAETFGLGEAPVWLVLPKDPGPAAAEIQRLADDLERVRPGLLANPTRTTRDYRAYRL